MCRPLFERELKVVQKMEVLLFMVRLDLLSKDKWIGTKEVLFLVALSNLVLGVFSSRDSR